MSPTRSRPLQPDVIIEDLVEKKDQEESVIGRVVCVRMSVRCRSDGIEATMHAC